MSARLLLLLLVVVAGGLGYLAGRHGGPATRPPEGPPPRTVPEPRPPHPTEAPPPPAATGSDDGTDTPSEEEDPATRLLKHVDVIVRKPATPPDPIPDLYVGALVHTPNGDLKILGTGTDYRLARHGPWTTRFASGAKASEETYRDGVREGPSTSV